MVEASDTRKAAYTMLEPNKKRATCVRAAGESVEDMVTIDAAADIIASVLQGRADIWDQGWKAGNQYAIDDFNRDDINTNPYLTERQRALMDLARDGQRSRP